MRETHLTDCDFDAAQSAAANAVDYMSTAFEAEFPDVPASRAAHAGELFMRALFLQDEIENRAAFDECLEHDVSDDVFVSFPADIPEIISIDDDPRWSDVQDLLEVVCDELEMDSEYAVLHTRFWRLHGQRRDNWQTIARRAHRIKVARMVPEADDETIDTLARYFVAGVSRHDGWVREGPKRDVSSTLDIVAQYYHRLFDLRTS